jgi:phosphatidate cytidylyltransferase
MTVSPDGPSVGSAPRFGIRRTDLLRIGSALVLGPLAILAAYLGGWLFIAFWGIAALGVVAEWMFLVDRPHAYPAVIVGGLAVAVAIVLAGLDRIVPAAAVIVLGAVGVLAVTGSGRRAWTGAGVLYAGALLVAPATLRADAQWGFLAVLILFAIVWTTDVAAYFGGRALQGPKLWPSVSPNKTWSGAVTGMLAAVAVASVVAKIGGAEHVWPIAVLAAGLSVVGQAGDLLESAVKRRFGAKDASHIIPGHGGIMDRLDAFVTAAAAAALLACARGSLAAPGHGLLVW